MRHRMRTNMSAKIVIPIDLCRLNASTRGPTGCFGIPCIHQPHANWKITRSAIAQCSAIAVRVYRSEADIDADSGDRVARGLEVAAGVADAASVARGSREAFIGSSLVANKRDLCRIAERSRPLKHRSPSAARAHCRHDPLSQSLDP